MKHLSGMMMKLFSLAAILAMAGCALPSITPPAVYSPTSAPTLTLPPAPTAQPVTVTPVLQPAAITSANAVQLKQVTVAPASNVQALDWSANSHILGLVSMNQDSSGNSVFSATLLDGRTLAVETVWAAPSGGRITEIGPDGRLAAVISADGTTATLYDLGDGDKDVVEITPGYTVGGITFSPDGKFFTVTDYDDMKVSIHNLPDGSENKVLEGFKTAAPVFDVGFRGNSADVVWHARAQIQLQEVETGKLSASFEHEDFVSAMTLSADGKVLASAAAKTVNGTEQPAVTLWDTASGNVLQTLVLPQTALGLSFSPDGSLLAVATGNDVQVWEVASGKQLATLSGHSAAVNLVTFSPDGKSLASSAQDNELILWQVLQ